MPTMEISEADRLVAEERTQALLQTHPRAIRARYDRHGARVVIRLDTGLDIALPVRLVEGLQDAADVDLHEIEITPTGFGLHWPRLDADIYVPGLLAGMTGSAAWMAANPDPSRKDRKHKLAPAGS